MDIHIILLAEGDSRRSKENKLLSILDGKQLYRHLTDRLEKIKGEIRGHRIVVSRHDEILENLTDEGFTPIYNNEPDSGISHSIILGLKALKKQGVSKEDAVFFFVCDQPYLHKTTIIRFLEEFQFSKKGIGCMMYNEEPCTPCIFNASYISELMLLTGNISVTEIVSRHTEDLMVFRAESRELEDVEHRVRPLVIVRGAGELASGTIFRLFKEGYRVLVLEKEMPSCIRRQVSYGEAVYDRSTKVEGLFATRIDQPEKCDSEWSQNRIPILIDPEGSCIDRMKPQIVVDGINSNKNNGSFIDMAPLTIAIGSKYQPGIDVDVVVDSGSDNKTGAVYGKGMEIPKMEIKNITPNDEKQEVMYAPKEGIFHAKRQICDIVTEGDVIGYIDKTSVKACTTGILRGCIKDGYYVNEGLKIIDIDSRFEELENCYRISDRSKRIAESVYEVIRIWEEDNF